MDFTEAEQKRVEFTARLRSGQLSADHYANAVGTLRVTDTKGVSWQPNPSGEGWIFWTGSVWQPGTPPATSGTGPGQPPKSKDFNEFKSSLMTVDEFKKISKDVPLAKRPQKWWDLLSILGGIVAAIMWFLYGGIRSGREGFDLITPLLMIAIPVFLVWFRADIDLMLLPLQPHRKKIARILLIGLGIATPFLTAWILYNLFHISQYPLIQANMVVGTLAAYMITRDPQVAGSLKKPGPVLANTLIIFTILFSSCIIAPVLADDCMSDPLNAQDCLRTNGYAEVMAGAASSALAILVNGPIILQTLLQGGAGAGTGVQPPTAPQDPGVPQGPAEPPQAPTTPPADPATPPPSDTKPPGISPEDQKKIDDAKAAIQKQKEDLARAAAEAKAKAAEAAAKAKEAAEAAEKIKAGIDPLTGKKILTPEQLKRKAEIIAEMAKNSAEAEQWGNYANNLGNVVTGLEYVEKAADVAIDVGATLSPGAGSKIKNIYAATKTIAKSVSENYADGKSLVDGLKDGVVEAATDKALDVFAGKVTDKFKGKIPGFGKFDSHTTDYGNMSLSDIKGKLGKDMLTESGDLATDLRNIMSHGDAKRAVTNSAKNALQGQVQGETLWDPFKKFIGISK